MSLRALCNWGIIERQHKRGERREYFVSLTDVWEMFSSSPPSANGGRWTRCWRRSRNARRCWTNPPLGKSAARQEDFAMTRQRLAGMEEFMSK